MSQEAQRWTRSFWLGAAFACFAGSVIAFALGSVLTTTWILNGQQHPFLHGLGLVLLIAALPILIAAGHCLDLRDRNNNLSSSARAKKNGTLVILGATLLLIFLGPIRVDAQPTSPTPSNSSLTFQSTSTERLLLERIAELEGRLAALESRLNGTPKTSSNDSDLPVQAPERERVPKSQVDAAPEDADHFFRDTTFNVTFDGYYSYNFNRPVGGINLLRAYDIQSNSFSLNQAALVVENAPNLEKGKRYGVRLDIQYGQATETVQGNAANEPRPQVYRNLWQAYGTYIFDVDKGLTVDFGKWAGSLGYETNYTKDNFSYSRSLYFNFLPFYHFGFRTKYPINDKVAVMYHLVNGAQQSEDFNGFKSHHVALLVTPAKRSSGQLNYYVGQEQRDRNPVLNPALATLPTQPGLSTDVIRPLPSGRFHVIDTYYTFALNNKWTIAVEGDYVNGRVFRDSAPATVWGGAGYVSYQRTPRFALRARLEYLAEKISPSGGLFSGVTQALKEGTFTAEYKLPDGLLIRGEYRRDWSNQPFFLTEQPGVLKKEQNTATLGLIWWWGRKQGTW